MSQHLAGLKSLGVGSIPGYFEPFLWIKKIALARITQLKQKAEQRAKQGLIDYYDKNRHKKQASYTLIWDENAWKTKQKNSVSLLIKQTWATLSQLNVFYCLKTRVRPVIYVVHIGICPLKMVNTLS